MESSDTQQQLTEEQFALHLKEANKALQNLDQVRSENATDEKKNFELLQLTFKKMKGLNNDRLPEYVKLMKKIVEYLKTPTYYNFFKKYDKKLTKNMVKRCIVEPFCDKFLKKRDDDSFEISRFIKQTGIFVEMNIVLTELDEQDFLTETLKSNLRPHLEDYLSMIENSMAENQDSPFTSQLPHLRSLLTKCRMALEEIDYHNKMQIHKLFQQKKIQKLPQYIRELLSLSNQALKDKKMMKKVFENKQKFWHFARDNLEWMLEKGSVGQLSVDEVRSLAEFCAKHSKNIVKGSKESLVKLDKLLKKFLSEQQLKHPTLNFEQYSSAFKEVYEKKLPQISPATEVQQQPEKQPHQTVLKKTTQKIYSLEQFVDQVVMTFADAEKPEYQAIDDEVDDKLRTIFKEQMGLEELKGQLFQILDQRLGTFKTPFQARTYKKVISSISKCRILDKSEINVLFVKANRFLDKDSVKKEKVKIKTEIKGKYIAHGAQLTKEERVYMKKGQLNEEVDSDGFEDVDEDDSDTSDDEEMNNKKPKNKRFQKEDSRNRIYLVNFREQAEMEQAQRFYDQRSKHTISVDDFKTIKGVKKILEIEGLVKSIYQEQCVSREDLEIRDKVITNIKNAFKNASDREYPSQLTGEVKISGFGSCQNGLWNVEKSDIDVTCIFKDKLAFNQHQLLKMCSKIIKNVARQGTLVMVPASRIPILKFTEKETGIEVDFNVNNLLGIYNSDLIFTYCQIDQRFHIMAVFLKYWAKKANIIGAAYGYLSSYALVLMIIAFLQSKSVLPCLQQKKQRDRQQKKTLYYPLPIDQLESKRRRGGIAKAKDPNKQVYCLTETDVFFEGDFKVIQEFYMAKEKNTKSVAELIYEFFYFYTYEFDYNQQVIDIISSSGFSPKCTKDKYPFSIVDPFETSRNPGCSVYMNSDSHKRIMMQFRSALDRFKLD